MFHQEISDDIWQNYGTETSENGQKIRGATRGRHI